MMSGTSLKTSPKAALKDGANPGAAPANGTDLAACREGRCEVRVRAGDQIELAERFGAGPLVVTEVESDSVAMRWTFEDGGAGSGEAGPNRTVTFGGGPTMLTVRVESVRSDMATVRITPGDSS